MLSKGLAVILIVIFVCDSIGLVFLDASIIEIYSTAVSLFDECVCGAVFGIIYIDVSTGCLLYTSDAADEL